MGTSLSCKDQNAFKLRPTQRRVCWKDTQKSLRNQGQRSITGSLESGKWSFFFFPSKRLHEGFHVSLSALPLSFNFLLCMPCSPPPATWTIFVGPIPYLLLSYLLRSSQFIVYTARIWLIFLGQVSTVGPITGWLLVKNHKPHSEHQRQGCHIGCSRWSQGGQLGLFLVSRVV